MAKFLTPEQVEQLIRCIDADVVVKGGYVHPGQVTWKLADGIRFHSLRHTCASWLVMRGVPLSVVQAMLGHSSIQVTQRYAHLAPKSFKDGIERAFSERNKVQEPLAWAA